MRLASIGLQLVDPGVFFAIVPDVAGNLSTRRSDLRYKAVDERLGMPGFKLGDGRDALAG